MDRLTFGACLKRPLEELQFLALLHWLHFSAPEQVATCSLLMHYFVSYALSFTTYTQRGAHEMKVNWHNGPWQQIITGQCRSIINSSKGGWLQCQVGLVTLLLRFRSSLAKSETPVTSYFTASNALCKTLEPVQCGKWLTLYCNVTVWLRLDSRIG